MQTRTYTERSNARRAARAAGLDPETCIVACDDGFEVRFTEDETPERATITDDTWPRHSNGNRKKLGEMTTQQQVAVAAGAVARMAPEFAAQGVKVEFKGALPADGATGLDIPEFLKRPPETEEERTQRSSRARTTSPDRKLIMRKDKPRAADTKEKLRGQTGSDKTATLLAMLKGKGSTVEQLTKALGWLPHTLRARISRLPKDDKKIKIARERVDGVTSYRIAS